MRAFQNRTDAGRVLARMLARLHGMADLTVLGLPRGGVPVAYEIAAALEAPLDVFVVRKLGLPGHEEYAMGAIATGGVRVLDPAVVRQLGIRAELIEAVTAREAAELRRREAAYRDHREPAPIAGRTVVLVDDGLATGATMHAAVLALRQRSPARIIVAAPVGSAQAVALLRQVADEVHCTLVPASFGGVGAWYEEFPQLTDAEVRHWLSLPTRSAA